MRFLLGPRLGDPDRADGPSFCPAAAMTATRNICYQLPEQLKSNLQQSHRLP